MNIPNMLTAIRLVLAPLFLVVYFVPVWLGSPTPGPAGTASIIILWVLFGAIEITDVVDGAWARSKNQITNLGKLLDPFADVVSRLTYFLCFTVTGIMPVWLFGIYLYRELGVTFLRLMFLQRGVTLAARRGGKMKALAYSVSGAFGLFLLTMRRLDWLAPAYPVLHIMAICVFTLAAFFALLSLADYLSVYAKARRESQSQR